MGFKEEELKALYYFLKDTGQLPKRFEGVWEKVKKGFKDYISKNDKIKDIYN